MAEKKRFEVLLTARERQKLRALAKKRGISAGQVLRDGLAKQLKEENSK